jgi:hypothetical protein
MATIFGTSRSSSASGCFEGLCAIRSSMRTTAIQTTDSTLRFAVTQVTEAAERWRDIRGRSGRTQPNKRSPWPNKGKAIETRPAGFVCRSLASSTELRNLK